MEKSITKTNKYWDEVKERHTSTEINPKKVTPLPTNKNKVKPPAYIMGGKRG